MRLAIGDHWLSETTGYRRPADNDYWYDMIGNDWVYRQWPSGNNFWLLLGMISYDLACNDLLAVWRLAMTQ